MYFESIDLNYLDSRQLGSQNSSNIDFHSSFVDTKKLVVGYKMGTFDTK
jgi:hypothetical protein